jgi:hypothetical protein
MFLRVTLPTWPEPGQWFFDPLSWQAMFVVGYVIGQNRDIAERLPRKAPWVIPVAVGLVAVSVVATLAGWTPLGEPDRESFAYYFFGKSSLGLLPIPQFLALALIATRVTWLAPAYLPMTWRLFSLLGRNSLSVFCAGTFLSALGHVLHRAGMRGWYLDLLFMIAAFAVLCVVARLREAARPTPRPRAHGVEASKQPTVAAVA